MSKLNNQIPISSPPPPYKLFQDATENNETNTNTQTQTNHLDPQPTAYSPYTVTLPITDVSKYSHSTFTRCPDCNALGLTRVEKKFSTCQVITGIILICSGYLVIFGILTLIFAMDYDHFCARCNRRIGRKRTFCC